MVDPKFQFRSYSAIVPQEERMRLIGVFVCRVARLLPEPQPGVPCLVPPITGEGVPDERVLAYLRTVREASPVEIRLTLGLSRSMTYRTLHRLVMSGQAASRGSTKAAVYLAVNLDVMRN